MKKILTIFLIFSISLLQVSAIQLEKELSPTQELLADIETEDSISEVEDNQFTDRFIVKYKEAAQDSLLSHEIALSENSVGKNQDNILKVQKTKVKVVDSENIRENTTLIKLNQKVKRDSIRKEHLKQNNIEYIQPDYLLKFSSTDDSEEINFKTEEGLLSEQNENTETENATLIQSIQDDMHNAKQISKGSGVKIAIIDGGIDVTHPALNSKVIDGWDFNENKALEFNQDRIDQYYHGTHIAGIISQVAEESQIIPLKVFDSGNAYTSDIIAAIEYAEEHGAKVVNCSWGSSELNQALFEAIKNSSMMFVCATGNNGININETPVYPAAFSCPNIISVASLNDDLGLSYYSNYGSNVDISAQGRDIYSTFPGGEYGHMNGTSMSAAYVTGAVSLLYALQIENVKERLLSCSNKLSHLQDYICQGRKLSLNNAVRNLTDNTVYTVDYINEVDFYETTPEENWTLFNSLENIEVAASGSKSYVLKANGTIWEWGDGNSMPKQMQNIANVSKIFANDGNAFALKKDGTLWGWGWNTYGSLGDGTSTERKVPTQILLDNIAEISITSFSTLAINTSGDIFAWGNNFDGQLGTGNTSQPIMTPRKITTLSNVVSVASGSGVSFALKNDGTVWSWGDGNLGNGADERICTPTKIESLSNITAIFAGGGSAFAINGEGQVYAWGANDDGNLGTSDIQTHLSPVLLNDMWNIKKILVESSFSFFLKNDGTVMACGSNGSGQLGLGSFSDQYYPIEIPDVKIKDINYGDCSVIALDYNGNVLTWGDNTQGQLGDGRILKRDAFDLVPGMENMVDVKVDETRFVAHKSDGTMWAWGNNNRNLMGIGDEYFLISNPEKFSSLSDVKELGTGYLMHTALKNDGTVWSWGLNYSGQLGSGSTFTNHTPRKIEGLHDIVSISIGYDHCFAIQSDGTVWAWGNNRSNQLGPDIQQNTQKYFTTPIQIPNLNDVSRIIARESNTFIIKSDGTILVWGALNQYFQQINMPGVVDIMPYNNSSTYLLKSDGTLWALGYSEYFEALFTNPETGVSTFNENIPMQIPQINGITGMLGTDYAYGNDKVWSLGNFGYNSDIGMSIAPPPEITYELQNAKKVCSVSPNFSYISNDNKLYIKGTNEYGQLGIGGTLTRNTPYVVGGSINDITQDNYNEAFQIGINTSVNRSIDYFNQADWLMLKPKYKTSYQLTVSNGFTAQLYKYENGSLMAVDTSTNFDMDYLETYYIKVTHDLNQTGQYTLQVSSVNPKTNTKAFETKIGNDTYYSDLADGGKLYKNNAEVTSASQYPVKWLCTDGTSLYYCAQNGIYKLTGDTVSLLKGQLNAAYLTTDGNALYFSNWSDCGKIYKLIPNNGYLTSCVCKDIGANLRIGDDYIYYQNCLENGEIYRVLKSTQNGQYGEAVH